MAEDLSSIRQMIKEGKRQEAARLLGTLLATQADNEEAWWLLSFAVEEREKQLYALGRVLRLNAKHPAAQQRLAQLKQTLTASGAIERGEPAIRKQKPASSAVIATRSGRRWAIGLGLLFLVTVGSALALTSALKTDAAELAVAEAPEGLIEAGLSNEPDKAVEAVNGEGEGEPAESSADGELAAAGEQVTATAEEGVVGAPSDAAGDEVGVEEVEAQQQSEPEEQQSGAESGSENSLLPVFDQFVQSVMNGDALQRVGVFVENRFSLPVVQQPANDPGWISGNTNEATYFRLVREMTGNDGILAHNYLSGSLFFNLRQGDVAQLVNGDGNVLDFEIVKIENFQALSPNSPTSDFVDLLTGESLNASTLFYRVYGGNFTLTFQTCIERNNISTWGRTFIIGEEF